MNKPVVTIFADMKISVATLNRAKCSDLYEALERLIRKGAGPERHWRLSKFIPGQVCGFNISILPADVSPFEKKIQTVCNKKGIKLRKEAFVTATKAKKKK